MKHAPSIVLAALLSVSLTLAAAAQQKKESSGDTVETDISSRQIAIESNFTGASLVVFGTILREGAGPRSAAPGRRDQERRREGHREEGQREEGGRRAHLLGVVKG